MTIETTPPIPETAFAPRSMADAPLPGYESHSSISTYRACPLRYAFRYVERRPGEVSPGQFAFGSAVHKAFEAFGLARIRARAEGTPEPGPEILQAALDRKLASSGLTDAEIAEARRRAVPVLARFLEIEARMEAEPVAVELGFGVGVELRRRAPAASASWATSTASTGLPTARPRSSTTRPAGPAARPTSTPTRSSPPTRSAAPGAACATLRPASTLPPASRLGLYFAESGELLWTARTEEQLAAFESGLIETVGQIHDREFAARPAPWRCRWCEYRRECPEASPVD